jgi:UDPglucose--hexose-1-phosphate uridylyltransferase
MSNKNEIRKHYYLDNVVIIAPGRNSRPSSFVENIKTENSKSCVLCDNKEHELYSISDENGWKIKSVNNPYGVLSPHQSDAYGYQEVVIESNEHTTKFSDLGSAHIAKILDVYIERIQSLKKHRSIKYVNVFRNSGAHAGATQQHCHSQIYAFPFHPPSVANEILALQNYKKVHRRCAVCDIINTEIFDKDRIVYETPNIIVLCPFASEFPYETLIIPKNHNSSFTHISAVTKNDYANAMMYISSFLESEGYDYNYYINDLHNIVGHTYLRFTPRVGAPKVIGGLELATSIRVNSVPPELAALKIKKYIKPFAVDYRYTIAR